MSKCSSCKKKLAVIFDKDWSVIGFICEYEPWEFEEVEPKKECENYEPNLHDHLCAPESL